MTSLNPKIARALSALAVLALPAWAVAPIDASTASGLRRASTPTVDLRHARVIVKYRAEGTLMRDSALSARDPNGVAVQHAARLSQRLGITLRDGAVVAPRTQVLRASNMSSAALVARLQADPDVEYAEIDERVRIAAAPNDPRYPGGQPINVTPTVGQWYLRPPGGQFASAIDAERAWDTTTGSPAIVVAVLDTGVRPDHPDLVGKLVPGYDFVSADDDGSFTSANDGNGRDADASDPGDWVTSDEARSGPLQGCDVGDSSWHGTQTAALVGAATQNATGMASVGRNVRVMPVRVLGKCGGFMSDVIAGMYWAAGLTIPASPPQLGTAPANPFPARVLNLSLGSSTTTCGASYQAAVNAVVAAGASVVVSAGNNAGLAVGQPANCNGAIGVGGLRHTGTKVGFSDVGALISISAPAGNCVNDTGACLFPILTAINTGTTGPGANTYSDSFNISVGTSFSAPLVAGAAALLVSANPTLAPSQVRTTLQATARPFPTTGGEPGTPMCQPPGTTEQLECYCTTTTCGAGMLDVAFAVDAAHLQPRIGQSVADPRPGLTLVLDADDTLVAGGRTVAAIEWFLADGGGIVDALTPGDAGTVSVVPRAGGLFTVGLRVTDSTGLEVTSRRTIEVLGSGGGGGAFDPTWLAALAFAALLLRRRGVRR